MKEQFSDEYLRKMQIKNRKLQEASIAKFDTSTTGFGEIITDREDRLLANVREALATRKDKAAKYVGLFGGWHIAMAQQLDIYACALRPKDDARGEWRMTPCAVSAEDFVPGAYTLAQVQREFPQEFNVFIGLLPKFATMAFNMPRQADPAHQFTWQTNMHRSNRNCLFAVAGAGLAAAFVAGLVINAYFSSKLPQI